MRALVLGAVLAVGLAGVFQFERRPEMSAIAHGRELAVSNGCYACHGTSDNDPRHNIRQTAAGAWKAKSIPTFWENGIDDAELLTEWITKGVPASEAENHRRLFIQMPAYESFMKPAEIDAVAAWILSEGIRLSQDPDGATVKGELSVQEVRELKPDELVVMGDRLSRRHGCYQCHGELGQGGVANPASFKGYIPGFFGSDFLKLTGDGDRDEIGYWLDHGRGRAVEAGATGAFAKRYFDAQAIGMPAYRDQLNATEKAVLTEYLLWLNQEGPLSAKKLERVMRLLNDEK